MCSNGTSRHKCIVNWASTCYVRKWLCKTAVGCVERLASQSTNWLAMGSTCASCINLWMNVLFALKAFLACQLETLHSNSFSFGQGLEYLLQLRRWRVYMWRTYLRMFLKRIKEPFDKHGEVTKSVLPPAKAGIRGILALFILLKGQAHCTCQPARLGI
jgi:hypothetical protein